MSKANSISCRRTTVFGAALLAMLALTVASAADSLQPVTTDEARAVAERWVDTVLRSRGAWGGAATASVTDVVPVTLPSSSEEPLAFLATVHPAGHVLVPPLRQLPPVASFSEEGTFEPGAAQASGPVRFEGWVLQSLAQTIARLRAAATDRRTGPTSVDTEDNAQAWEAFLGGRSGRESYTGDPDIELTRREPLLDHLPYPDPDDPGQTLVGALRWDQTSAFNRKTPRLETIPEEIWVDLDGDGIFVTSTDQIVYDADGTSATTDYTVGSQGGLYYYDRDGSRSYTAGEDVWRADSPNQPDEYYDPGDTRIYDGGDGLWTVPSYEDEASADVKTVILERSRQDNLYYTDANSSLTYTFWVGHTLAGCGPVAFGQILRYWQWPGTGQGEHTYQWEYADGQRLTLEANFAKAYDWQTMPLAHLEAAEADQQDEVAQLLYDLGVCLEVDYGLDGTITALSDEKVQRLANRFGYSPRAEIIEKENRTEGEWFALLQEELDAQRPFFLGIFRAADKGHAVVVDGYDKTAGTANLYMIHCNMGWGGLRNAYYTLHNVNGLPGGALGEEYPELDLQLAVTNILPRRPEDGTQYRIVGDWTVAASNRGDVTVACDAYVSNLGEPDGRDLTVELKLVQDPPGAEFALPEPDYGGGVGFFELQVGTTRVLNLAPTDVDVDAAQPAELQLKVLLKDKATGNVIREATLDRYTLGQAGESPVNSGPTAPAVSIAEEDPGVDADLTCVIDTPSTDPDGHDVAYVYSWRLFGFETQYVHATLPAAVTRAGDEWDCEVVAIDELGARSDLARTGAVTIGSSAPSAPTSVTIASERTPPTEVDALVCVASGAADPEGDLVSYVYTWLKDGNPTQFTEQTLDPQETEAGDVWSCQVRAMDDDGIKSTPVFSDQVTIASAAPSAPAVSLAPDRPAVDHDLVCNAAGSQDPLGVGFAYTFIWRYFRGGVWNDSPVVVDTVPDADTAQYDIWICYVNAWSEYQGTTYTSSTVASNAVTVGDVAPSVPSPPTTATVQAAHDPPVETDDLTCSASGGVDPDGGAVTYTYRWHKNGNPTQYTQQILSSANTRTGDVWACNARSRSEAGLTSSGKMSNEVTIATASPSDPSVNLTPGAATEQTDLQCAAQGAVDPLLGEVVYAYAWKRQDGPGQPLQDAGVAGPTVAASQLQKGQIWVCAVTAENAQGYRSNTVTSNAVTILNIPPSAPTSVLVDPDPAAGSIVCEAVGASDPDLDGREELTFWFEWQTHDGTAWVAQAPTVESQETTDTRAVAFVPPSFWRCVVYVTDGSGGTSARAVSNTVHLQADTPEAPQPAEPVEQLSGPVWADGEQILFCELALPDGSPPGWVPIFTWYQDGQPTELGGAGTHTDPVTGEDEAPTWFHSIPKPPDPVNWDCQATIDAVYTDVSPDGRSILVCAVLPEDGGDGNTLLFRWYRDGFATDLSGVGSETDPGTLYPAGRDTIWYHSIPKPMPVDEETWTCRVSSVSDQTSAVGATWQAGSEMAGGANTPPSAPVIAVVPETPTINNDLRCEITTESVDPDGEAFAYAFTWFKDGAEQEAFTGPVVPASATQQAEDWYCEAVARDSRGAESPAAQSNAVTPGPANGRDQFEADDTWDLAQPIANGEYQAHNISPAEEDDWLRFEIFGDPWVEVRAQAIDLVADDAVLGISLHRLNQLTGVLEPADDVALFTYNEDDGGLVARNDWIVPAENGLDICRFRPGGGTLYLRVHGTWTGPGDVFPAYGVGVGTVSPDGNEAPTGPTYVSLAPESPVPGDVLRCVAFGSRDEDGDAADLTYVYDWFQNDNHREDLSGIDQSALPASVLELDDQWTCNVTVYDLSGEASPTVTSNAATVGGTADWSLTLDVAGSATPSLTIGQAAEATDGWDEGLDDLAAPDPGIVGGLPAVYLNPGDGRTYSKDIRGLTKRRVDWTLVVSQGAEVTLSWDSTGIPSGATVQIKDVGGGPATDMTVADSLALQAPGAARQFRISFSSVIAEEVIHLEPGWNLISARLSGVDDAVVSVFAGVRIGSVWGYDAQLAGHKAATVIEPGSGYWVYSVRAYDVRHVGYPQLHATVTLHPGWNLVGPLGSTAVPVSPAIRAVLRWSTQDSDYENTVVLEVGQGYWFDVVATVAIELR